jgi:hypothetical protein
LRQLLLFLIGGLVRLDADVIGLVLQFDPMPHAEAPGHLARALDPARPVQGGVLARGLVGQEQLRPARSCRPSRLGLGLADGRTA